MKTFLVNMVLILITLVVTAQQPDNALIRVKYAFSHMRDTTQKENFYKETMLLVAGKNASVFLSYDKIMRDLEAKAAFEEQARQSIGTGIRTIKAPPFKRFYNDVEHYYFISEGKHFTKEPIGIAYLIEENIERIDWKISKETLKIEGINCKKAIAYFKGRNWTAWFAEELPFASGPWKLVGLPGLIVQAYDENKEVSFEFAGFEKVEQNQTAQNLADQDKAKELGSSGFLTTTVIKLPSDVVKASIKDLERLKEARDKDPQGFAKAQLAAMGMGGLKPIAMGSRTPNKPQSSVLNNPVEKKNS